MRFETKFIQVPNDPDRINALNNMAAVWGWSVQNIQITDNKVTREGDSFGWVTEYGSYKQKEVVTEHTNYASITYQRDMDHPHYAELCALEKEYNSCDIISILTSDEKRTIKLYDRLNTLWKIIVAIFIICAFIVKEEFLIGAVIVPIIFWLAPPIWKLRKAANNLWSKNYSYKQDKKQELIEKAKSL